MKKNLTVRRTVLARSVLAACGASALAFMAAQPVLAQTAPTSLNRVEVTGSAVRRTDAETALHLQVLTKEDIARTGATSTEELLKSVSALSSAGATNNSSGAGNATYGNSNISLRGLEPARTLVLVNGRRLATFADGDASVNVNTIPLAAIERIEVLKDGASSTYGSDAMAGVVNFILTKSFNGVEISATAGTPTNSGGGANNKVALTAGIAKEGSPFSAVVSLSMEKETALFAKDREYAKTGNKPPFYTAGATGQGNIEGAVFPGKFPADRQPGFGNSPGAGYGNPNADAGTCSDINMFLNPTATNKISRVTGKGAPFCAFDSSGFVGLTPDRELTNLTGNLSFKLTPQVELFSDIMYSKSTVIQTYQSSPLRRSFAATNTRLAAEGIDPSLIIYPNNPNYPTAYLTKYGYTALIGQPLAITSRVFDFGGRQTTDTATQTRLVAGAKGTIWNQDYEVAMMTNSSKLEGKYTGGYFSIADYNKIINDPTNNWNPWIAGGAQTGALAAKLKTTEYRGPSLDSESKNQGIDGKITGEVFSLPGGAAQYAVGFQTRQESLSRSPAPKPGTGDISGAGGAAFAIDKDRQVNGLFAEVNLPLLKGLEANVSVRSDRYSDFGTADTYKISGRWQPRPEILVRSSYNTGFRAPTLPDLYAPQILGSTEQFDDNGPGGTGQTSLQVNGITGGNDKLQPETSTSQSVGFVFAPNKTFSIGLDWFNIKIKDIIQTPGVQEVVSKFRSGDPAFRSLVVLDGNDIDTVKTITSNLGTADVEGIDIFANYRQALGPGVLNVALNGTLMTRFDQTSPSGTVSKKIGTLVEEDGTPVIGADAIGGVILPWKHALTASWTQGNWATSVTQNFSDKYRVRNDLNGNKVYVDAQSIFDLNVTYNGIKNASFALGVKNFLDTQPGTFIPVSNQFQAGYDISQYDPRGRFVYISGKYKF